MKIIIRNRWTGDPIYTAQDVENVLQALTEAIGSGANLSEANLSGADLFRANLSEANLFRADLSEANLFRADLSEANLSEADLSRANLYRADLSGADLFRADGIKGALSIGPIGSRDAYLTVIRKDDLSLEIQTGCFCGTLDQFKAAVKSTHDGNRHGENYTAAIALIEAYQWGDEGSVENKTADFAEGQAKEKMMEV